MPSVIFSHPVVNDIMGALTVETGADEISWGYRLNTQTFPTYGGEVVQILSAYTDDLSIQGTLRTYREMERVYTWFLHYIQVATQTGNGEVHAPFNQAPIQFDYPHRGWSLQIVPKRLPGFRYGRDVVAPQWQLQAAVIEGDRDLDKQIVEQASARGIDLTEFGRMTAEIGFIEDNPFSAPFAGQEDASRQTRDAFGRLGDYYSSLIDSYAQGDYESLHVEGSKPAFLAGGNGLTDSNGNFTGLLSDGSVETTETP